MWYLNKTKSEIIEAFAGKAKEVESLLQKAHLHDADEAYDEMEIMYNEVVPVLVDMKAEFYMDNKEIYQIWEEAHDEIKQIRNSLFRKKNRIESELIPF